jgi:hypothetical protein
MRLNPFYPSDDPMSSVFYCFGGGGDDGSGGGDSRSEADRSYEDDFGFSSDLADKYSGSAADVGGSDDRPAPAPAPASSAMDTAIANALANIDTASLADISTPMMRGDFVDPTTGFGMMQDIPGSAMQSAIDAAQLATPGLYGSQATTGDSFAGLLGDSTDSLLGFYETTPVPRGSESNVFDPLELEDLQQGINMRQAMPGTGIDEILGLQARLDQRARIARQEEQALRNQILGNEFVDTRSFAEKVAAGEIPEDVFVYNVSAPFGDEILTFGLETPPFTDFVSKRAATGEIPANRFEGEVVPGFGASIDRAIGDFMGEYYGGRTEQLPDGTIDKELFTDLGDFVSRRDRNARNPGNIGVGSGAALGATSNRNFQSADFLSGYSPVAQQRMQEGYLADYGIELPNIEVFGKNYPISPLAAGVNALANPEYTMTQALRQGATPVYGTLPGQQGSILGATSPSGDIVYSNAPIGDSLAALKGTFGFGPGLDPNMEAAYARQRALDDAERARNDSNDQAAPPALTLPDPVTQECPEGYTRDGSGVCVYEGRAMALNPFSASRGPRDFQYTGVGSLQPFILQPTPVRQADPVDPFARMRS